MHAIANPLRPTEAMGRISRLISDAARAVLLLGGPKRGGPKRGGKPGKHDAPKPPQPGPADDLGEDNQLI